MRRCITIIGAVASLGVAALAGAQTSPPPAQGNYSAERPPASSQQSRSSEESGPTANTDDVSAQSGAERNTRLTELVPAGSSAQQACSGFKSISECAATLHAAQNCGIAFKDLKSKVTGGKKLGAAIHDLKPDADVRSEVSRAEEQARADLRSPQG